MVPILKFPDCHNPKKESYYSCAQDSPHLGTDPGLPVREIPGAESAKCPRPVLPLDRTYRGGRGLHGRDR